MQLPERQDFESRIFVDGHHVGVSRYGRAGGWPLVWCHGGLSSRLDGKLLDAAGQRHGADIIAVDRPGIGGSDLWAMPTIAHWAATIERLVDDLHIDEFAVAGWSAGAPYALACAAAMPGRVCAVATLAGMAPLENHRQVSELGFLADVLLIPIACWSLPAASAALRLARSLLRWLPDRYLGRIILRTAGSTDAAALDETTLPSLVAAVRQATRHGVRGTAEDYRRFGNPSWGFDLRYVPQSVTVWQGEDDTLLPMSHARRLASALPAGILRTVPATGHYLPAVIADAVIEGLAPTT